MKPNNLRKENVDLNVTAFLGLPHISADGRGACESTSWMLYTIYCMGWKIVSLDGKQQFDAIAIL